ncbi:hypothetical protein ACFQFH_12025 [Halobaculum halobium]|uniref:Uncharacterized protein n=1 Tax=Halobaculum halobium TaxID=3032281 RepID=A0ABD5TB28_9EURY|nr:hypothetical protein [Halobaculum sp. SYNS20]
MIEHREERRDGEADAQRRGGSNCRGGREALGSVPSVALLPAAVAA